MRYLYGDSSTSPFTSNFLELLRDAIDFSVYLLEADQRMVKTRERTDELRVRTHADCDQLEALGRTVASAVQTADKSRSPTAACAERMMLVCDETVQAAIAGVRARLASDMAQAEAEEATEREGCLQALLRMLEPHVPPDSSTVLRVPLTESGTYEAVLDGVCVGLGLEWRRQLEIPDDHPMKQLLRVESLQRRLEVDAPDLTGWIKKQVAVRPQNLERLVVTHAILEGSKLVLRLRAEPGSDEGFDLASDAVVGRVAASRLVAGPNQAAAGAFDVAEHDAPKLMGLCESVHGFMRELTTTRAFEASFDDAEFQALSTYVPVVERLVGYLAPMVQEIAKHSLEPDELVLRRQLTDDRREEIFVSKTTLREKYEHLPPEMRGHFTPLGLRAPVSRSVVPLPAFSMGTTTRSELPPSNPPPPPAKPATPVASIPIAPPPPPTPTFTDVTSPSSGRMRAAPPQSKPVSAPVVPPPTAAVVSPATTPRPATTPSKTPKQPKQPAATATAEPPSKEPAPVATREHAQKQSPAVPAEAAAKPATAAAVPSAPTPKLADVTAQSQSSTPTSATEPAIGAPSHDPQGKGQALAATLRKILEKVLELDGAGRQPEAYEECAKLLEGPGFGSYSAEDQRRVLKLLLVLESRATPSDARIRALRAGRQRAHELIQRLGEPADYELKGLCQLALQEPAEASETFRKGLELETAKSSESELGARLRRHASAL